MIRTTTIDRYLERWFPDVHASGDERTVQCPRCHQRGNLRMNVRKGVFICNSMRKCGYRGTIFRFVKDFSRVSDREVFEILYGGADAPPPSIDYSGGALSRILNGGRRAVRRRFDLPEGYRPLPCDSVFGRRAWSYLTEERGVTADQIATHRIGVATRGRYEGCVIVPIVMDGRIVHYVARAVLRPGTKRYLNAPNEEVPRTASECIFNYDVATLFDSIIICEGIFDALAEGDRAVCLFGKKASSSQLELLRPFRRTPMVIKLDEDAYGDAQLLAVQLKELEAERVIIHRPYGDPGDRLGIKATAEPSFAEHIAARVWR